jgi:hypothetical protein
MTSDELQSILELHKKWLTNEPDGKRIVLCCGDLHDVDLHGADLRKANLYRADLCGAYLYGADLREANLYKADLHRANLRGVDLRKADLRGTDLRGADLRGANLIGAIGIEYIIVSSPIGSRNDVLIWDIVNDVARTEDFVGTLDAFEAAVEKTHADNLRIRDEYRLWIAHFKAIRLVRFPEWLSRND